MDKIVVKVCVISNTESNDNFYNKYRKCKQCNIKRVLKRYYDKKRSDITETSR